MSAQSTIARLREEIAKARAKGMDDGDIIHALTDALTHEQLVEVYKQAVRSDRSHLSSAIESTLFPPKSTQRVRKTDYPDTLEGAIAKAVENPETQSNVGNQLMGKVLDAKQPNLNGKKVAKKRDKSSNVRAGRWGERS